MSNALTGVGAWLASADPAVAEVLAGAGFDVVVLDLQHALLDEAVVRDVRRVLADDGPALLARVEVNDPARIGKALDAGADGVVVPLVSSAEEAARAVAACRYPPQGSRSFGPVLPRPTNDPGSGRSPLCVVMVETAGAVARVAEIAATPGLDGVLVGPADLALDLGLAASALGSDPVPGELADALGAVVAACRAHGVVAGLGTASPAGARLGRGLGFALTLAGGDRGLLRVGAASALAEVRDPGR